MTAPAETRSGGEAEGKLCIHCGLTSAEHGYHGGDGGGCPGGEYEPRLSDEEIEGIALKLIEQPGFKLYPLETSIAIAIRHALRLEHLRSASPAWTSEAPKVEGWYWIEYEEEIDGWDRRLIVWWPASRESRLIARWAGPLPMPPVAP